MRIKTIERIISLSDLYTLIKPFIEIQYEIVENSFVADSNFLIAGVDLQSLTIIIRGSVDRLTNRTYLSVNALKSGDLLKILSLDENSKPSIKLIGNSLYNFIKDREKEDFIKPFISLGVKENELTANNHDLIKIEKNIFNKILDVIKTNFGYSDELIAFPFSINVNGAWEFWEDIYHNLVTSIKNNLKVDKNSSIKTYAYYDFSLTEEFYQRIFDLIIVEEKEMNYSPVSVITGIVPKKWDEQSQKRKEDIQQEKRVGLQKKASEKKESDDEEKGTHYLWLSFVITNRTLKPMTMIQTLKLIQEVKNFAKLFKKKNTKYIAITPSIIFLSLFGYEQEIGKYLRDNLFRDQEINIPIFTVPPINKEIWHNLKADNKLSYAENDQKKVLENMSTVYSKMMGSSSFKKSRIENAEKQFKQFEQMEKHGVEDDVLIKYWAEILRIQDSNELLDLKNNQNKIISAVNHV